MCLASRETMTMTVATRNPIFLTRHPKNLVNMPLNLENRPLQIRRNNFLLPLLFQKQIPHLSSLFLTDDVASVGTASKFQVCKPFSPQKEQSPMIVLPNAWHVLSPKLKEPLLVKIKFMVQTTLTEIPLRRSRRLRHIYCVRPLSVALRAGLPVVRWPLIVNPSRRHAVLITSPLRRSGHVD